MSWDSYVDTLTSSGQLDKACIWGNTADSDWTATAKNNFKLAKAEVQALVDAFNNPSKAEKLQSEGFHLGGIRYVAIRVEGTQIHGKKDKEGVIVYKTNKALVIGHYPEGVQPGNAVNTLDPIAQYLIGIEY